MTKKISLLISFALILILVSGCNQSQIETQTFPLSSTSSATITSTPSTLSTILTSTPLLSPSPAQNTSPSISAPVSLPSTTLPVSSPPTSVPATPLSTANPALEFGLNLSRLPKPGETAELDFSVNTNLNTTAFFPSGLENTHAWVEFYWTIIYGSYTEAKTYVKVPSEEVLFSGDLEWRGSYRKGDILSLKSTIQLPREGIWHIKAFFSGENWRLKGGGSIQIASAQGLALDMRSSEFKSSPLAYLADLPHGSADNVPINEQFTEWRPVIVVLDLAKAPGVGEEVGLTCSIYSQNNITDFTLRLSFIKRTAFKYQPIVPGDELSLEGKTLWTGNLQADTPVVLESVLKLLSDGDWEIGASGNSSERVAQKKDGYADSIDMTIDGKISYFGWK
jgi:hypothetical protein